MEGKMTKYIGFTKMHGAGNDYIYIDATAYPVNDPEKLAIEWSKFHTGIGSDGLVLIGRTDVADFSMRIFNADGSEALMCGNATRCIGKFVYDNGLTQKDVITLETLSGIKTLNLKVDNKEVKEVTVDMGAPGIGETALEVEAKGRKFTGTVVSMGNPHLVIFVDDIETVALEEVGPVIEYNPLFPNRTNVEFVQLMDDNTLRMRVWERGSGITQACGTGACATAVAANITGRAPEKVRVVMDGGPLSIEWDKKKGAVFMTGGATKVFEGTIAI